ncbi:tetratricopeptide repeat protein [Cognaticolwellia beringensis]|uniref:Sel1 repeat family protein n=1 Tax=Cognaticolwellia beringensis TaxID=1967665 RepID=A0A222G8E6_9GAMM|nr:tetratricopeptide repeat protein [Cognaticolwellia beringensis]ASP48166.1 sel1 repeat family protein [Cognaticolwellia beringensis]
MKKLTLIALSFALFVQGSAYSADLDLGIYELNRGEFKAAIAEFEPLVAEEYAPAQYQMALIYLNGYGVLKSPEKALELLHLAASQNYSEALFDLSLLYSEGEVVKKDLKSAYALMEKAAKKDLPRAQFNLGVMLYNGSGVPRDYLQASRWYQKAADQNYALAQFNLALMYFEGKGVAKSTEMSYVWNIIAAKNAYRMAEKSRDMDEHKLTVDEIKASREKADTIYQKIIQQRELKLRQIP